MIIKKHSTAKNIIIPFTHTLVRPYSGSLQEVDLPLIH